VPNAAPARARSSKNRANQITGISPSTECNRIPFFYAHIVRQAFQPDTKDVRWCLKVDSSNDLRIANLLKFTAWENLNLAGAAILSFRVNAARQAGRSYTRANDFEGELPLRMGISSTGLGLR
jgi:hypothetical protein